MDNHENLVDFSHEVMLEKMQQEFEGSDFITVYRKGAGYPNYDYFIFCELLPSGAVNQVVSDKSYLRDSYINDIEVGDETHDLEPLAIMQLNSDIVEIAEEFKLFHGLYYDKDTGNYTNSTGEVIVSVNVIEGGYEVKMRRTEIQSFLAIKEQHLSLLFEMNKYSEKTLKSLGLEATSERPFYSEELLCWVYQYREATRFSKFPSNCYVRGRKFIAPAT